jgi:N-acetylmuramoyl-L-alanine amidase
MTRPIANARNVAARTRRRQGSWSPLRSALIVALLLTCVFSLPTFAEAARSVLPPRNGPIGDPAPGQVVGQIALDGVQPGACLSLAAIDRRSDKTVFIDPGHGGLDPGVVGMTGGRQILEKDVALAVGIRLATLLSDGGYRVVMSRTKDSSVTNLGPNDTITGALTASAERRDLATRAACANAGAASVLVAIHFDAFDDSAVAGTETFYDAERSFAAENKRLATDLQSALVAGLGTTDRGIWTDDQLAAPTLTSSGSLYGHLIELGPPAAGWVDNPSQMPGALVEPLFLTNATEAGLASSSSGQQRIAAALNTGLERYLSGA